MFMPAIFATLLSAPIATAGTYSPEVLDEAYLLASLPDPGAATTLSAFIGFGAGHFYAGEPEVGGLHFAMQTVGAGTAIGTSVALVADSRVDPEVASAVIVGGSIVFALSRLVDIGTAPQSARRAARRTIDSRR